MADIYIPTYGRVGRQPTYDAFPPEWQERTVLVCRPEESAALSQAGATTLVAPVKGISATRQWIIEQHEGDRLLMFDDDLKFAERRVDEPTKFLPATEDGVGDMLVTMWGALSEVPVVGLAARSGANRVTAPWRFNERLWDVMGFDMTVLRAEGFKYRTDLMEDFDIHLQFLTRGYPSAMLNAWTKDDFGSNAEGGCSTYRTAASQAAAALWLHEEWEDFVMPRYVKSEWTGIGQRVDVTVYWKKAFQAGQKWRRSVGLPVLGVPDWNDETGLL